MYIIYVCCVVCIICFSYFIYIALYSCRSFNKILQIILKIEPNLNEWMSIRCKSCKCVYSIVEYRFCCIFCCINGYKINLDNFPEFIAFECFYSNLYKFHKYVLNWILFVYMYRFRVGMSVCLFICLLVGKRRGFDSSKGKMCSKFYYSVHNDRMMFAHFKTTTKIWAKHVWLNFNWS